LLNDILDISKFEAGKVEFEAIPFAPAGSSMKRSASSRPELLRRGLLCAASIDPMLPDALLGDPIRLRQVLLNLLSNAIKFTDAGLSRSPPGKVSDANGMATIECSVRDTGIGIAPNTSAISSRSFRKPMRRSPVNSAARVLGLPSARRSSSRWAARSGVASTLGGGTTFSFELTLPISDVVPIKPLDTTGAVDLADELADLAEPLQVLLAEDNGTNQLVFSKLVQNLRLKVTIAHDGREAVEHASRSTFDVIFHGHANARDGRP
jgi:hypothetical protein